MRWLNRSTLKCVERASPSTMAARYPADVPFVDGDGNAASNAAWVANPDLSGWDGVAQYWQTLDGDTPREMNAAEKAVRLEEHRTRIRYALIADFESYVTSHYSPDKENRLRALLEEAHRLGLTARAAYIQTGFTWGDSVSTYYSDKLSEIAGKLTVADLDSVVWDFSQYDATDPGVTWTAAVAING